MFYPKGGILLPNPEINDNSKYITIHKKKLLSFCIVILIIIGCFFAFLLRSDVLFKAFPNAGLLYSYKITFNELEREAHNFTSNFEKQLENTNLEKGNKISISLPNTYIELTKYDDISKGYLNFYNKFDLSYYLDDTELIFNINNSKNYSILLDNYFDDNYAQTQPLKYTYDNTTPTYFKDKSFKTSFMNYSQNLIEDSRYEYIKSILLSNKSVTIKDDHTDIVHDISAKEFKDIVYYMTDYFPSDNMKIFVRIVSTLFLGNADNVYITSTLYNSDKLGNVIRKVNISTNNRGHSYFEIESTGKNSLLEKFNVSYEFLSFYDNISFSTDFNNLNNSFIFSVDNNILSLTFENSTSSIIINSNNKDFIRISDDLSTLIKPSDRIILNKKSKNKLREEVFKFNTPLFNKFFSFLYISTSII